MDDNSIIARLLPFEGDCELRKGSGLYTLYDITAIMFEDNQELIARLMTCNFTSGICWKAKLERFLKRRGWEKYDWPKDKPIMKYWKVPPHKVEAK